MGDAIKPILTRRSSELEHATTQPLTTDVDESQVTTAAQCRLSVGRISPTNHRACSLSDLRSCQADAGCNPSKEFGSNSAPSSDHHPHTSSSAAIGRSFGGHCVITSRHSGVALPSRLGRQKQPLTNHVTQHGRGKEWRHLGRC